MEAFVIVVLTMLLSWSVTTQKANNKLNQNNNELSNKGTALETKLAASKKPLKTQPKIHKLDGVQIVRLQGDEQ